MSKATLHTFNSAEEAEEFLLKEAAARSYTERFRLLMKLIKVSSMIKNAKVISGLHNNNK